MLHRAQSAHVDKKKSICHTWALKFKDSKEKYFFNVFNPIQPRMGLKDEPRMVLFHCLSHFLTLRYHIQTLIRLSCSTVIP